MTAVRVNEHIYMVDVEAAGVRDFVASYIVRGESVAIVESGPTSSIQNLINGLKDLDIKPSDVAYVALSHIHLDHGGGVGVLVKHLPKAKIVVHRRGAPHLANPEKLWQQSKMALGEIAEFYGKPEPVPLERVVVAEDGMTIDLGKGVMLKVLETLGHASHHLCYYEPLSNGIFTGDAAGVYIGSFDVIVPTTPPPFRLDIALASLDRLASLKPLVLYYTHFGKANKALERFKAYAEQLKLWAEIAKKTLEGGGSLETLRQQIIIEDEFLRKALNYIRAHRVMRETVLKESVEGVFEYVRNLGSSSASS